VGSEVLDIFCVGLFEDGGGLFNFGSFLEEGGFAVNFLYLFCL
jgi:hypothetical protein